MKSTLSKNQFPTKVKRNADYYDRGKYSLLHSKLNSELNPEVCDATEAE